MSQYLGNIYSNIFDLPANVKLVDIVAHELGQVDSV